MSRYWKYNFGENEPFALLVQTVEVHGLFGGKGVVKGTVLSGTVRVGDSLCVHGGQKKQFTVTAVQGASGYSEAGVVVRVELSGIKKKDVASGATLMETKGAHPLFTDVYAYRGRDEDYFAGVFTTCFPDYQIQRNVSIQGQEGESIPVEFLFSREGRPCLAVFLRYSDKWRKKEVAYLKSACRYQGMEGIVLIRNFRNTALYVCDRVESVLG